MPQPFRNWYFEPDPVPPEAGRPGNDDGIARAIAHVSPTSLQRHGARTLNPSAAPTIPGLGQRGWGRTPSSTVYRARTLQIPADLLRDEAVVAAINAALVPVGMSIVLPDLDGRPVRSQGPAAEALRRLPRIAGLVPAASAPCRPAVPVVVDATPGRPSSPGGPAGSPGPRRTRRSPGSRRASRPRIAPGSGRSPGRSAAPGRATPACRRPRPPAGSSSAPVAARTGPARQAR
jgi:hypothetical protein